MTNLFQLGDFTLASGVKSRIKIECDALTLDDWTALAAMAVEVLPPFSTVKGVPTGGLIFAALLKKYVTPGAGRLLLAEDVVTTGGSIERFSDTFDVAEWSGGIIGVCAFARGPCPAWVTPLFTLWKPT